MINPSVHLLESKLKLPRSIATISVMGVVGVTSFSFFAFIIMELIQGTTYLAEMIPKHIHTFTNSIEHLIQTVILPVYHNIISIFHTLSPSQQLTIQENLQELLSQSAAMGGEFLQNLLMGLPSMISIVPNSFAVIIFILLATFFMTNDWENIKHMISRFIPEVFFKEIHPIFTKLKQSLIGYMKAQLFLVTLSTITIIIGLLILQVDHAITIALLAGIADILPFIGTGIIFIPWIIYLFITANHSLSIGITILYMFVVIQRQILEPKVVSNHIGLNPLIALIGLFVGYQLWGIGGLILTPILLVMISAVYQTGILNTLWQFIKG